MTILIRLKGLRIPRKTSQILNASLATSHRHIAINCSMKAERVKHMRRFQAHATEDSDQEVEEEEKKDE